MADSQSTIEYLLRLASDTQSTQKAVKDIDKVVEYLEKTKRSVITSTEAVDKLNKEFAELGRQRGVDQIIKDFAKLPSEIRTTEEALQRVADNLADIGASDAEIKRVGKALAEIQGGAKVNEVIGDGGGFGNRRRNAVQRIGSEIRALPAIPLAGNLSTDAIGKVAATLGGLNPVAIGAAAAVGGLALGLKALTAEAGNFTKAFISSQEEIYRLQKTGSREQVQAAIEAKQAELEITRARAEENRRVLEGIDQQAGGVGRAIADVFNLAGVQDLRVETQKLEDEQRALELGLSRLQDVLENTDVAATDAAAAAERLNKSMQDMFSVIANSQIQATLAIRSLNSTSARERIDAIEAEKEAIAQALAIYDLSDEAIKSYSDRLLALNTELQALGGALPDIDARTQRQETLDAIEQYNDDVNAIEEQRLQERVALTQRYNDQVVQITERAADAAANALRKLEDQREKLTLGLARAEDDAGRKSQLDQLDAQIEFQREEVKAYESHTANLKRIRDRFQFDEADAVAERDALAAFQAERRKKQEIDQANEAFSRDRQEQLTAFSQQNQDRRVQFDRERQERLIKYNRDLFDAQAQYNRETALAEQNRVIDLQKAAQAYQQQQQQLTQKYAQELRLRQTAIQQELQLIQAGSARRLQIEAATQSALLAQAQRLLSTASAAGSALNSGGASGTRFGTGPTFRTTPSFDTGGRITRTGMAMVHEGEIITNPRRGQYPGGINIPISVSGLNRAAIRNEVLQQLDRALDMAGAA